MKSQIPLRRRATSARSPVPRHPEMGEREAGYVVHHVDGGAVDGFHDQGHLFIGLDLDFEVWWWDEGVIGIE